MSAALLDYVFKVRAVETYGPGDGLLRFFALYYAGTSLVAFVLQMSGTRALLERFGRRVSGLRVLLSHGGVFRVRVGNELVFDKAVSGYDLDEIVRRVSVRVRPRGIALGRRRSARDDAG